MFSEIALYFTTGLWYWGVFGILKAFFVVILMGTLTKNLICVIAAIYFHGVEYSLSGIRDILEEAPFIRNSASAVGILSALLLLVLGII